MSLQERHVPSPPVKNNAASVPLQCNQILLLGSKPCRALFSSFSRLIKLILRSSVLCVISQVTGVYFLVRKLTSETFFLSLPVLCFFVQFDPFIFICAFFLPLSSLCTPFSLFLVPCQIFCPANVGRPCRRFSWCRGAAARYGWRSSSTCGSPEHSSLSNQNKYCLITDFTVLSLDRKTLKNCLCT